MKKILLHLVVFFACFANAQLPLSVDNAYMHLKEQFDCFHITSYVYADDNAGGNIYIPSIWQGGIEDIYINQACTENPYSGRSCTKIVFPSGSPTDFSAIKWVYPENNTGIHEGFDMSGATQLSFQTKGEGIVEFFLGGMNRRPFYNDTLQFQDGVDIRSSGFIELTDTWEQINIDLTNDTFWVYKDSISGLNNKYIQPMFMDDYWYFTFRYGADDGQGGTCMSVYWFGGDSNWAGVFLFPPDGDWTGTQGYDLSGIQRIHFKAKISDSGKVKFLFGKGDDSCGEKTKIFTLSTEWESYIWDLDTTLDYTNIVGGFGFYFGGNIGTPNYSTTYIDSVYYDGLELASDFSNLICGYTVSASKSMNPDTVIVYVDEVSFNKNRTSEPRFSQSYISWNDSIDLTQKNASYAYDNALKLLVDLIVYDTTSNTQCLDDAKLTGDAFIYAIDHDRYFTDGRIRNAYMSGELIHYDGTVRMPGWWDDSTSSWYEDKSFVSTNTGNVAWVGLALTSLYEVTQDSKYLNGAMGLANWCIDKTGTDFGFTGGFEGWEIPGQDSLTWKSTEHNIDLYALFSRLYDLTFDSNYYNAGENAKDFVLSMWNPEENHFWTGTDSTGITLNTEIIPLDIQMWYVMSLQDTSSQYTAGVDWGKQHCYLSNYMSPLYQLPMKGYDFNDDLDGIWLEGSSQAALANKMLGNEGFAEDSVLSSLEYIQTHHNSPMFYNCNNKGLVAADHDHLSTGFDWEYHNRLHIGATCWYIFAKLGFNPFYFPSNSTSINNRNGPGKVKRLTLYQNYPNPFTSETTISFYLHYDGRVELSIYNITGRLIKVLANDELKSGFHKIIWDGTDLNHEIVPSGIYFYEIRTNAFQEIKRMILLN